MNSCVDTSTDSPLDEQKKSCIDDELRKYPNLQRLVAGSPKLYKLRHNLHEKEIKAYQKKLKDKNGGTLSDEDESHINNPISCCEIYFLGGILLEESKTKSCWSTVLEYIESTLQYAPETYTNKYRNKICDNFQTIVSELTVYDVLHKLGYEAEYEPDVYNTGSRPDFCISDKDGEKCFIEVKTRYESFEEVLQSCGKSDFLEQTGFADIDEPSYKLETVVCTAINRQISEWNRSNPNIPVYLVIESMEPGFLALNLNKENLLSRLRKRTEEKNGGTDATEIPENLKGVIVFTFCPRRIRVYLLSPQQHEFIGAFKTAYKEYIISIDEWYM